MMRAYLTRWGDAKSFVMKKENNSFPKIREFSVRAVRVPMTQPHRTASGVITESPLVLTDVMTDSGSSGHSIVFTYKVAALKPTADQSAILNPW